MTRGSQVAHDKRNSGDLYPTSPDACVAIGGWLAVNHPEQYAHGTWFDPTAGFGTLLEWSGIPIEHRIAAELSRDPFQVSELQQRIHAENLSIGVDATDLTRPWPVTDGIIANYPFLVLDTLIERTIQLHVDTGVIAVLFTPCAFWHAQSRSNLRPPDHLLALGWRPNSSAGFKTDGTEGSSPAQDYVFAIYDGTRHPDTNWKRIERPTDVPQPWVAEHKRLARHAAGMAPPALPLFSLLDGPA